MKTAIIKILIQLLTDEKTRHAILITIASVVVGLLGMLAMPVVVIYTMGQMDPPALTISEEEMLSGLDADRLAAMESGGQEIANQLLSRGLRHQIMKAQLIYLSCFDENIPDSVIKAIAKRQPLRAVFRDSSFNGSPAKINVGEIFKMLAPDTRIKVI